ncbi:hypothetical protein P4B35_10460 [Pontiellaceae bacterium B12227]|nr:hypothetical protein [Pontiellaceae bacterium B12227]
MTTIRKSLYSLIVLAAGIGTAQGAVVLLDTSTTNSIVAIYESQGKIIGDEAATLYLSTSGISSSAGGLEIDLFAHAEHPKNYTSSIVLGADFATVTSGEVINLETAFNTGPTTLVELLETSGSAVSETYDGYLAFRFDAGAGQYYYGAAEITATATRSTSDSNATAMFIIKRMAYNDTADEGLLTGATFEAVPEPAVVTLVLSCGIAALGIRRIFNV